MANRVYNASPTLARFHASDAFVRGIRGPFASGKSVGCCVEIVRRAGLQQPNREGIRKSRWAVIRNTYGELRSTTIKTWQDWIPDEVCPLIYDSPIRGRLVRRLPDGTTMDLEMLFIALDRPDHIKKLLSLELTGAWLNEAREIPKAILDGLTGRVGRYPAGFDGGASWSGIIMDTNPCDEDHWWYRLAEEETPIGYAFFAQPAALIWNEKSGWRENPLAENIGNLALGYEYYFRQVPGKDREWIKVYIEGKYGAVRDGKPVYPEYSDDLHCRGELVLMPALPLVVGLDFGLTPAAVLGQSTPRGRLNVLRELTSDGMGIMQFLRDKLRPLLSAEFPTARVVCVGDPAGAQRAQTDEKTCFEIVRTAGFEIYSASTNGFLARREAVAAYLNRMTDGQPAYSLDPRCKVIRRGFLGGYRYPLVRTAGTERHKDSPEKNEYSHPHDGQQYLALFSQAGVENITSQEERNESWRHIPAAGTL
jgi:hypothetical protein